MEAKVYKIRKAVIIPLSLSLFLGLLLLALCLIQNEPPSKIIVLSIVNLVLLVFLVENLGRALIVGEKSITHKKFLRRKTLLFADITSFEALSYRRRVFSTLSSEESFMIFTNAYENYPGLAKEILARLPNEVTSRETRELIAAPPVKHGDIVSFWITVIIFGVILLHQASPYFN
jgi:hypothetical protein